jgi:hypothetical protein
MVGLNPAHGKGWCVDRFWGGSVSVDRDANGNRRGFHRQE